MIIKFFPFIKNIGRNTGRYTVIIMVNYHNKLLFKFLIKIFRKYVPVRITSPVEEPRLAVHASN